MQALQELVQQLSLTINAAVAQQPRRPRHLLVIVNPYGGAKQARALYQSVVQPVFGKAGKWGWGMKILHAVFPCGVAIL